MTPEGQVKADIKDYLDRRNVYWFMPVQAGYGSNTLDFLCCLPVVIRPQDVGQTMGLFVGIEAKRAGVITPSVRQGLVIEKIQAAGGTAFVANDWSQVASVVGAYKAPGVG